MKFKAFLLVLIAVGYFGVVYALGEVRSLERSLQDERHRASVTETYLKEKVLRQQAVIDAIAVVDQEQTRAIIMNDQNVRKILRVYPLRAPKDVAKGLRRKK